MATDKKVHETLLRLSAFFRTRIGAGRAGDSQVKRLRAPGAARDGGSGSSHESGPGASLLVLLSSTFLSLDAARLIMQTVWSRAAPPFLADPQAFPLCPASWQSRGAQRQLALARCLWNE